jgi:short-subunit dehydrogenase
MVANGPYCMTKTFVSMVSRSLWYEFLHGKTGIDVLDYRPAFVETKLSGKKAGLFVVTTKEATKSALDDLGQTQWTNGPFVHHLTEYGNHSIAEFYFPRITNLATMKESMKERELRLKR